MNIFLKWAREMPKILALCLVWVGFITTSIFIGIIMQEIVRVGLWIRMEEKPEPEETEG